MAKNEKEPQANDVLAEASKEVQVVLKKTDALKIKNEEDATQASTELTELANIKKSIKERKDLIVKPLKEHVKYLDNEFKKVEAPVLERENYIRTEMSSYARKIEAENKKKEEAAQKRYEKKVEKAEEQGKVVTTPAPTIERKKMSYQSSAGNTSMRKVKKITVTDFTLLLKEPKLKKLLIEEARSTGLLDKVVKKLVDAGENLKGVEVTDDFVPVVRT